MAGILTLKDHAGFRTGRQQALVVLVVADGTDVLVRESVLHVLPASSAVRAAEGAFARGKHNLPVRGDGDATNAGYGGRQTGVLPAGAVVLRNQHIAAGREGDQVSIGFDGDEI